ncbi:MAG: pyridoxal phosphate-dependent aminotransferase [Lachnospiraceae bacterium]|nr:pyridoxal phosphate-dependent aminotransferase [Lachnospiraceae bacterium]
MPERNLDFDQIINRKNTKSLKYDFAEARRYPADALPLWVADMDFKTSSYIEDALREVVEHNIYGYTQIQRGDDFFDSVAGWMKRHHDWDVLPDWHVHTPGVCVAIANAIQAYTEVGDAVLIQQPVYYPFSNMITQNARKLVVNELLYDENSHYSIDYEDFENKIRDNNVKLFILCNPHNPVGRVWSKDELERIGDICDKYNVIVFSDEIHFDFIWKEKHYIFQEVKPEYRNFTITATAPSKTFNLAGVQQSNIFIPNEELRRKFKKNYDRSGLDEPNIFGVAATQAAYTKGDEWYNAAKNYIFENIKLAQKYVDNNLPGVKLVPTEGTYLIWLDFTETKMTGKELDELIINKGKLWLSSIFENVPKI